MANYRFESNVDEATYRAFLATQPYSFMQLPEWAHVKKNWGSSALCGVFDGETLVAAALLLIHQMPAGFRYIYIGHGPVLDFNNEELVKAFTNGIRAYAKKIGAFCVRVMPFVVDENYPKQQMANFGNSFQQTIDVLKGCGYIHRGLVKEIHDTIQPRVHMAVPLFNADGPYTHEQLYKHVPGKTRYYLGSFHKDRGIEFKRVKGETDYSTFIGMLDATEERKGIYLQEKSYYDGITEAFGERAITYYAIMHLNKYIDFIKERIEAGDRVEQNQAKLEEAERILAERGNEVCLGSSLVIFPREDAPFKMAEYAYAGSDLSILAALRVSTGIVFEAACDAIDAGCAYLNLGGVSGTLDDSVAKFKLKFKPQVFEFTGEFDLVVSSFKYHFYEKWYPKIRKLIRR